ncbi:phosphoribosylformylglycinamidine synthase subunit PurS [Aminithiophilus ramosus]|uniref:Phosphoribosylformylglycinamidine synthase subunit PurS n=2 Tax=Synergistales TaxID=649776 RepID=A0A9Q7AH36_9BACT|nr:phosphoribosylformylglycinamidine synthase subunit PurS [Aminithiophilus ramosus]QTX32959.1 phosphoribosylformylglycinamidine synthase subunit PurS [Aminithiophilus ramosus]QVL37276.1 phosphoribosylformylglycinamidine synthase subunit PurS [Synergistota bacterium]
MLFDVAITISLKKGVLDTQGKAVAASLHGMGYETLKEIRVGRFVEAVVEAPDSVQARSLAAGLCDDLLVNDLIEESRIEVKSR